MCTIQLLPHIGPKQVKVAQSCPALCDPMDYRAHGTLQARILGWVAYPMLGWVAYPMLGWVAYPLAGGSSRPRDRTGPSCIVGGFFTS